MQPAAYIDGRFVPGQGATLTIENPSDESVIAQYPGASLAQVNDTIESSRTAFDAGMWSGLPRQERAAIMYRLADHLATQAGRLIELAVSEGGCPRSSNTMQAQVGTPLRHARDIVDLYLTLPELEENPVPLRERVQPSGTVVQSLRRHTPVGVVAGVAANNVPFFIAMWKVLPALVAGNTMILRPNPLTPSSAMILAEAADAVGLPPGVLNVVLEAGLEGGQLLSTHPAVDMVAFTGSSSVGAQVMAQAAATMKRIQLELGGKSAQIFLPDAVDRAAMQARIVCTAHAGQGCALGTRVFVPEERKAEVLEQMAAGLADVVIGPADDPKTQLGPVISAAQRDRCEHYVDLATQHGARVVTGGRRPPHLPKGYFFEPTVLDAPDNANPAAQEEIFGPILTVIGYRDLDHAIAMANDSRYGLSGYVHGADKAEALRVALAVRSGTVHVNGVLTSAYASSGGQRMSGILRERGIEGLRAYQQVSCLTLA